MVPAPIPARAPSFTARGFREELVRNQWLLISNGEQEFGHEMDFDTFVRWVNGH